MIVLARKTSPVQRRFELEYEGGTAILEAESVFRRAMRLTTDSGTGGLYIAPLHAFTRRAVMEMNRVPFAVQCAAFWLTVLMWRRDSDSAPASASA